MDAAPCHFRDGSKPNAGGDCNRNRNRNPETIGLGECVGIEVKLGPDSI